PPKAEPGTTTPPIVWSPTSLQVTIAPGVPTSVQVTALIRTKIPATTVNVVPALAPYVTTTPNSLTSLPAGSSQPIMVAVNVPDRTLPQVIQGTMQLRSQGALAQALPITVTIEEASAGALGNLYAIPTQIIGSSPTTLMVT